MSAPASSSEPASSKIDEMIRTNERQKGFYDRWGDDFRRIRSLPTKLWASLRKRVTIYRRDVGVKQLIRSRHLEWMGDLSDKRVLDLGCYDGNSVSLHMAKHAREYLGVDLSEHGIERLKGRLREERLDNADAVAVDFLSADYDFGQFDIVYAYGVMHHFEHFDAFLEVLHSRLKPQGIVVAFDPLETSIISRLVRAVYRPFQSDKDWEWPFTKKTFPRIREHFEIVELQGSMGYAKWTIPFLLLPFGLKLALALGRPLHRIDEKKARQEGRHLWRCLNVALHLRRKDND